jgi:hypothetical protein
VVQFADIATIHLHFNLAMNRASQAIEFSCTEQHIADGGVVPDSLSELGKFRVCNQLNQKHEPLCVLYTRLSIY